MPDRLNTPAKGTSDWHQPLNENFNLLDTDVEVREARAPDAAQESPDNGAKFLDTTTGDIYIGDGSSWGSPVWTLGDGDVEWQDSGTSVTTDAVANLRDNLTVTQGANNEAIIDASGGGDTVEPANGRATLSTDQSISTGSTTTVPFDGTAFDSTGSFDSSNYTFTIPSGEGGIYHVSGVGRYTSIAADTRIVYRAEVNGSFTDSISGEIQSSIAGGNLRIVFSGLVSLAAGDTLSCVTYQDSGSSQTLSSQSTFGFVRVDQAASSGDGGSTSSTDVIASPNHTIHYSELANNASIGVPVAVPDGQTLTVKSWGASHTDGTTPTGLNVALVDPSGTDVLTANTAWATNSSGITSYPNSSGSTAIAELELRNETGSDVTDPAGVGGRFGYEVK